MSKREMIRVDRRELLGLLDHVDSLVNFCSCHMPDVDRYDRGAKALWAVVCRLAGDDAAADRLISEIPPLPVPATPQDGEAP